MSEQKGMRLGVVFDGEELTLPPMGGTGDMVAFERHFNLSASAFAENQRLDYVVFLIYRALRKIGKITKKVAYDDDFVDRVDEFYPVDEAGVRVEWETPEDPTDSEED